MATLVIRGISENTPNHSSDISRDGFHSAGVAKAKKATGEEYGGFFNP